MRPCAPPTVQRGRRKVRSGPARAGWLLLLAACAAAPRPETTAQTGEPRVEPEIPATARTPEGFVPAGWTLARTASGDLDGDGRDGDALLLITQPAGTGTPKQLLAVILREALPGTGYALAAANRQLVPQSESPGQEDPLADGELVADTGGFEIKLTLLAGVGSYETASLIYRFRHEPGCFRLIGYQRLETHRATLATHDLSVDFLTGAIVDSTGNAASDAATEKREQLGTIPHHCFADLGPADRFDPLVTGKTR
jgi:hypothetical protein